MLFGMIAERRYTDLVCANPESRMSKDPRAPGAATERRIVARERAARAGDLPRSRSLTTDLDRLFAAHRPSILRLCQRMTRDPQRAEELVQEALLVAHDKFPHLQEGVRFSTWIYGIARNLCLNAVRKRADLLTADGVMEPEDNAVDALRLLRRQERARVLSEASQILSATEQEVVHMRYVMELPLDRIEDVLHLDTGQARLVLQRSKRRLQRELRRRLAELGHGPSLFQTQG